jgi:hypothetical protein
VVDLILQDGGPLFNENCSLPWIFERASDIQAFSQTAISKLERRKDMKLSTLIDYVEGIGMGLEIRAYSKDAKKAGKMETLLKM